MVEKRIIYLLITVFVWVVGISDANAQKKYEEIYINLPNWSVDQSYSELMDYQRMDPYLANVYIQLGIISEQKLINTDPLREIENTKFWAKNAELFWGNFDVYYKEDDARHSDYYENLRIPQKGKRLTDAEVKSFVKEHRTFSKNYADTAIILYEALERSKTAYNTCLSTYRQICDEYTSLNEALLCYDKNLVDKLKTIEDNFKECISQFDYYKQVLKQHPLLHYRQIYDLKPIPTFRLDGLTNSDFLQNRFFMWDFKSWIDQYNDKINKAILPLRKEIEDINSTYVKGYDEWKKGKPLVVNANPAYDELFLFRLGHYDNNSLVRELFAYLETRRELMAMAQDSIALPLDSVPASRNRHLRHIYRSSQQYQHAEEVLASLNSFITDGQNEQRMKHFADFFKKNYGSSKITAYPQEQKAVLGDVFYSLLDNYAKYLENVHDLEAEKAYSQASGKLPAIPMWEIPVEQETTNIIGQYITRCLDRNSLGIPSFVAGDRILAGKQQPYVAAIDENRVTLWVSQINKATAVLAVRAYEKGCVVQIENNKENYLVYFNDKGKETERIKTPSYKLQHIVHNMISGTTSLSFDTDSSSVMIMQLDSLQKEVNTLKFSNVEKIEAIQEVGEGVYFVVGSRNSVLSANIYKVSGSAEEVPLNNGAEAKYVDIFRPSAREICIIYRDDKGKLHYEVLSNELKTQLCL